MPNRYESNNNLIEADNSMYLYVILVFLSFMVFGGSGWYYNTNYSEAAILAKNAAASANSANASAQLAVNAAAESNSAAADKAAADAVIAATKATAAAAETKKAADDVKKANDDAKKTSDDAKKADDESKAALAKTLSACKTKLNIFTGTDGKKYICPPMYSFGNQNPNNHKDIWLFAEKNQQSCWMTDGSRKGCNWGGDSCDPSTYKTPNGKQIALNKAYYGTPESKDVGNYYQEKYPDLLYNVYAINKPMEYSDAEYCPA